MTTIRSFGSVFLYFVGGLVGLIFAVFLSTKFLARAVSQVTPPTVTIKTPNQPPPPTLPTPALQQAPAVQQAPPSTTTAPAVNNKQILLNGNIAPEPTLNPAAKQLLPGIVEDYTYIGTGKRDPFLPYIRPNAPRTDILDEGPLTRYELEQLAVRGIIWDVKKPKAMISDPTGRGYVVIKNDRIGRKNGYIADIREGEIVVVEKFDNQGRVSYQTRILKLQKE